MNANKQHKAISFTPDLLTGRLSEDSAKQYFSRFGWFAFALFLINSLVQVAVVNLVYYFFPTLYSHYLFSNLLSIIPLYCVALPIAYQILRSLPLVEPIKEKMSVKDFFSGFCICLALMIAGNYIANIFIMFFQNSMGSILMNPVESAVSGTPWWVDLVFVVILAPMLEEILFRGICTKRLLMVGEGYAIIISSAFFALFHGNFFQLFYAFALGCFFSFIYVKTGKLIYSIIYHMLINFLGGFVAPLILEYIDVEAMLEGFSLTSENLFPLLALAWYELITIGGAIVGIVIICKKYKEFKPQSGLLPPPEGKGASCVMLNAGIAAAVAIFALTLFGSIIP